MTVHKKIGYYTLLAPDVREALARYKQDVGVPETVVIDRALRQWLTEHGVMKAPRPRAGTRGRG